MRKSRVFGFGLPDGGRVVCYLPAQASSRAQEGIASYSLAKKWKMDKILQKQEMGKRKLTQYLANFS